VSKVISSTRLTPTLELTECKDGFWLYDTTRGMNLAMKAKTAQDAFVKALEYYQGRLLEIEKAHAELSQKVDAFVSQFQDDTDDG
jgi:hypothetical protein